MPRAFVIRPFGKKADSSGRETDFEFVHTELIAPALKRAGLSGSTTVEVESAGNIRADMFALILEADLVICDITVHNANVFYEMGVRHALRKRGNVMIKGAPSADTTPFDLLTDRYLSYQLDSPRAAQDQLVRMIERTLRGDRLSDSPVFGMMPDLPEVDPAVVRPLPIAFTEEVGRAVASGSKGWLRLLAEDVMGRGFERAGLRMIGTAQWRLSDLLAARESLERIRDVYPNDVAAGLALANVYERLAKPDKDATLLLKSDQAISRVLANAGMDQSNRVEAYALRGRNLKTIWRWEFEQLGTTAERRGQAMNQRLRDSYAAYRDAFLHDQNHLWSGLNALQLGVIQLDLMKDADRSWRLGFENDEEADCYRSTVERDIEILRYAVRSSIEASLARFGKGSSDALWARVSQADVLFADGSEDERVLRRYKEVLRELDPFGWNAVRGQLELYELVGFRGALARQIIDAGDKLEKPVARKHAVVVFAGHQPDLSRKPPRFPNAVAAEAKARILGRLRTILTETEPDPAKLGDSPLIGLASAAPGGDILFHEACAELRIPSIVCLPIPKDEYVNEAYKHYTEWRARLLNVMESSNAVLELSDRAELPAWLADPPKSPPIDFWERGNRWVLAMARAFDPERAYLLALWDGVLTDGGGGGTAHMVRLARAISDFREEIVDTNELALSANVT